MSSAGSLLALAREHGLALSAEGASLDESGADFRALHARDERGVAWVVREPLRADVMPRAQGERLALALVRPRLPVAVPEWRIFSDRLIAYPRLEGEPAAVVDAEAGGYAWRFDETHPPEASLHSLADVLAALHSIPTEEARAAGLPVREPAEIRAAFAERMRLAREELRVPDALRRRWRAWLADDDAWPERPVPVHGDLHPGHLLLDDAHRVVGLLDWTEAHVGDPATDFALLYATLGPAALDALLARYAERGGLVRPGMAGHVAETWAAYPTVVAEFARLTGEASHLHLAQALVDASSAG